jgi:CPA2 family monovalent cation:H+ antiporter-2
MEPSAPAIFEIGFVLLIAALCGWVARRIGLPAVVGYLAVGLAVSPFSPGYVADRAQLQVLADVGVVLLLFEVGIEIDPIRLGRGRRRLLVAAPIQTLVSATVAGVLAWLAGLDPRGAVLIGLSVALSSSVVIVNITRSRRRTTDPQTEEDLLGWSVVQDICGVAAAAVLLPVLGLVSPANHLGLPLEGPVGSLLAFATYIVIAVAAAWMLPRVLRRLLGEQDLFLMVSIAIGLALAGAGALLAGVPLALAAFIAGLAISESKESVTVRQRMLAFRDVFATFFFVSVGALFDPRLLAGALPWVALLLGLIIVAKVFVSYVTARAARLHARHLQLAVGLGQIGEFSFVLATLGLRQGVLPANVHAAVVACLIVTIIASMVLVRVAGRPGLRGAAKNDELSA